MTSAPSTKPGRRWPWILAGALTVQAAGIITMVTIASSDPSFAVEPDYYQRAVAWDSYAAQREASRALAWRAEVQIYPSLGHEIPFTMREPRVSAFIDATLRR